MNDGGFERVQVDHGMCCVGANLDLLVPGELDIRSLVEQFEARTSRAKLRDDSDGVVWYGPVHLHHVVMADGLQNRKLATQRLPLFAAHAFDRLHQLLYGDRLTPPCACKTFAEAPDPKSVSIATSDSSTSHSPKPSSALLAVIRRR
eukprot:CAMPEP_0170243382 /NCGR_PEP_ID=MMETSP0116_2-20130129/21466_1 /TAXON_ID=400756 /ORGANISM="Durinskia baltica, Strain CSIRO CS-38" /LENGTH=146 /DNA_ID=CAMNT_0010494235 /DNA_START=567 /DNA_END=1004 /DNA_ORIENTATION=-